MTRSTDREIVEASATTRARRAWIGLLAAFALSLLVVGVGIRLAVRTVPDAHVSPAGDEVPQPESGESHFVALDDAVQAERTPTLLPAVASTSIPEDASTSILWGFIHDLKGNPLPKSARAVLSLTDELGATQVTKIAQDGAYKVGGLAAGRWFTLVRADGYWALERTLELSSEQVRRQDFELGPQTSLRVLVLAPDGRAFPEALDPSFVEQHPRLLDNLIAVATLEAPGDSVPELRRLPTDTFGVETFEPNLEFGESRTDAALLGLLRCEHEPPLHVSLMLFQTVLATRLISPGETEVTFTLDAAAFLGSLSSLEFTLLEEASLAPLEKGRGLLLGSWVRTWSTPTDARGRTRIEGLAPGRYSFIASAHGYANLRRSIELTRGSLLDLGVLQLPPEAPIHGRVTRADGTGAATEMYIFRLGPEGIDSDTAFWVGWSADDGTFELAGFPPGRWLIQAHESSEPISFGIDAVSMCPNIVVDTHSLPPDGLLLRLEPVAQVAVRWTGSDRRGLRLRFFDEQGLMRRQSSFRRAAPEPFVLPPGRWRAEVTDESGTTLDQCEFTLGNEPIAIELGPKDG